MTHFDSSAADTARVMAGIPARNSTFYWRLRFSVGDPAGLVELPRGVEGGQSILIFEPPLLDKGGPALIAGDAVTVEPGLYCKAVGGVRPEDLVVVTEDGCENLNRLQEGLTWV